MAESYFLGVEIGGTKLQMGVGRGDGRIAALERRAVDPADGANGILGQLGGMIDAVLARVGATRAQLDAVGIGFGGPVDAESGVVTRSHHVPGWDAFPLADWFREHTAVSPVALHNDADTAGLAETRFGAGRGVSPVLYLTVGSGIGGGLIINDQIYRGAGAGAMEIGHLWIVDRTDSDFDVIQFEDIASGWALDRAAREYAERQIRQGRTDWPVLQRAGGDLNRIHAGLLAQVAKDGDFEANFLLNRAIAAMANALSQAVILVAPHRIILGGGVSLIGEEQWIAPIREQLDRLVFGPFRGTFDVVGAALGEEVVVHGALAIARDACAAHPRS